MTATKHAPIILPEYNGWANYPTWNVMLWINNDEASYRAVCKFAERKPDRATVERFIRDYMTRQEGFGAWADIKGWAKHYGKRVDWAVNQMDFDRITEAIREDYA